MKILLTLQIKVVTNTLNIGPNTIKEIDEAE